MTENDIIRKVEEGFEYFLRVRRELHEIPEIAFCENKTSAFIKRELNNLGIEYKELVKTGITAVIEGQRGEKTLGIRADMDALPVCEQTGLDFKSKNAGMMHACGHDIHMAALLGTAKILNNMRDKFSGNVKLVFQPAEEGVGGAYPMICEGALENPKVDAMIAAHVWPGIASGSIQVKSGGITAAPDEFNIKIKGRGGHAAYPHQNINPISLACQVVSALEGIKNTIDPFEPLVVCVTKITAGQNFNIVPDTADITGTVRVIDKELREKMSTIMENTIKGILLPHGGEYDFDYKFMYPPTVNDPKVTNAFAKSAAEILGDEWVLWGEQASMIGEDFAYFAEKVPATFVRVGCGNTAPLHSSKFSPDENCLKTIGQCFIKFALDFLNSGEGGT